MKLIIKIRNSKLVILLEYQNIKTFLQKTIFQNWPGEVFLIKNIVPWTYVISDFKGICWSFERKRIKNQKEFRAEKVIKRKVDKLYVK